MYGVGTDSLTVVDTVGAPIGTRHAVAPDGMMLCRPIRPRYTWPALGWDADAGRDDACVTCVEVAAAALEPAPVDELVPVDQFVSAYPDEAAFVPAQHDPTAGAAVEPSEW